MQDPMVRYAHTKEVVTILHLAIEMAILSVFNEKKALVL